MPLGYGTLYATQITLGQLYCSVEYRLLCDVKGDLPSCLTKLRAMKTCGKQQVYFHAFLTRILDGTDEVHSPTDLPPRPTYRPLVHIGWEVPAPLSRSILRVEKKEICAAVGSQPPNVLLQTVNISVHWI